MSKSISYRTFLWDVFLCSLGAYGGPEAHFGVFSHQLVQKKNYVTQEELTEYIALTTLLPGPSSTQTIVAIGYKIGGPWLAFLTMLVWGLPVILAMTALSFLYQILADNAVSADVLRFIGPMAVGFIAVAAVSIGRKTLTKPISVALFALSFGVTSFYREFWVFPTLLVAGGAAFVLSSKEPDLWQRVKITFDWRPFLVFAIVALAALILSMLTDIRLIELFEQFYRYGYSIIGGGQVVVPYMYHDLVEKFGYLTSEEFLTGFGLVQGLPGPMFSFSAYAGGMAMRGFGILPQILGGILSAVGIFMPGVLLVYFFFPVWEQFKQIKGFRVALKGVGAIAAGLIASAGVLLFVKNGITWANALVVVATAGLLFWKKIPAPLIVVSMLLLGILL
jgi:chromate transporter